MGIQTLPIIVLITVAKNGKDKILPSSTLYIRFPYSLLIWETSLLKQCIIKRHINNKGAALKHITGSTALRVDLASQHANNFGNTKVRKTYISLDCRGFV